MISYKKFLKQISKETDNEIKHFDERVDGETTPKTIQLTFYDNVSDALEAGEAFEIVHLLGTFLKNSIDDWDIENYFSMSEISSGSSLLECIKQALANRMTSDYMESKNLEYEDL